MDEKRPLTVLGPDEPRPPNFYAYAVEAVCDGERLATSYSHSAALTKFAQVHYPCETYDQFISRFELIDGDLRGKLKHGWFDRETNTFCWDYEY